MKRPPSISATVCVEIKLALSALVRSATPSPSTGVVLWTQTAIRVNPPPSIVARIRTRPSSRTAASKPNSWCPAFRVEVRNTGRGYLDPALDSLVPLTFGLKEPDLPAQHRVARRLDDALHPQQVEGRVAALGVRGRVHDPERGRGRVLGRARRVGIERVAPRRAASRAASRDRSIS